MEQCIEHALQNREKRLKKLQEMDEKTMEDLLQELRIEHQHLIADEAAGADGAEQRYYQDLLEQNENQSLLIQKKIDRMYQQQTKLVTPKAPLTKNVIRAFFVGGMICLLGQIIINFVMVRYGLDFKAIGKYQYCSDYCHSYRIWHL